MVDLTLKSNKRYIDWINDARKNGISWDKITFGNGNDDEDLEKFLEIQKVNFWNIDTVQWKEIVKKQKEFLDKCSTVVISDPQETLDIEVPENGCFSTYINKLKNNFSQESIDNIVESTKDILSRLRPTTLQSDPIRGLVMGNVQSGKTANMAGLIALAADYGYNMFIVLSGTIENLRLQTEERLITDLNTGKTSITFQLLHELSAKHSIDDLSNLHLDETSKIKYLKVCLKNSTRLRDLINWINKDPKKKKQLKILVIDDEADQAGINTANIDKGLQTKISSLIKKLVFAGSNKTGGVIYPYKCMNYIAYTATPYANFLNEASDNSLYPKNFIATLNVPNEYFGPQQIFGSDESDYKGLSIVNEISKSDVDSLKNNPDYDIPKSLSNAISWFLCTVAMFRYYDLNQPVSMLIHTSQKQSDHEVMKEVVKKYFEQMISNSNFIDDIEEVWNKQTAKFDKNIFRQQYNDYGRKDEDVLDYPNFDELRPHIYTLVQKNIQHILLDENKTITFSNGVHLCVDNCYNNSIVEDIHLRLAYPKKSDNINFATAFIVIGGATLSRGLTLEGLTTTFFIRNSQQADTLMQMGRWFGYRRKYELMPRIWLSKKTLTQFEFLSQLDEDLRIELKSMQMFGRKPSEYGPRINRLPKLSYLKVTNKKKMQKAIEIEGDYNDYQGQTTSIFSSNEILKGNLDATVDFVNMLGEPDNGKIANRFNQNSKIWLDVPYLDVFNYLGKLQYPKENSVFTDIEFIKSWYKDRYDEGELLDWNVVLPGVANSKGHQSFDLFELNLVNRAKFDEEDDSIMRFGAISDPKGKKMDVNENDIQDFEMKDSFKIHRKKAKLFKTPVLVIYVIDKQSEAKTLVSDLLGRVRKNLDCDYNVVGYDLYIPYGDENKHVSGGKITVKLNFDLSSGDIDED